MYSKSYYLLKIKTILSKKDFIQFLYQRIVDFLCRRAVEFTYPVTIEILLATVVGEVADEGRVVCIWVATFPTEKAFTAFFINPLKNSCKTALISFFLNYKQQVYYHATQDKELVVIRFSSKT